MGSGEPGSTRKRAHLPSRSENRKFSASDAVASCSLVAAFIQLPPLREVEQTFICARKVLSLIGGGWFTVISGTYFFLSVLRQLRPICPVSFEIFLPSLYGQFADVLMHLIEEIFLLYLLPQKTCVCSERREIFSKRKRPGSARPEVVFADPGRHAALWI